MNRFCYVFFYAHHSYEEIKSAEIWMVDGELRAIPQLKTTLDGGKV